jgi:hypothetical protein
VNDSRLQVAMDFYIGVDQDVRRARQLIREACLTSRYVFLDREVPVLTKQVLLDSVVALHIKARPYVLDTERRSLPLRDLRRQDLARGARRCVSRLDRRHTALEGTRGLGGLRGRRRGG